MLYFGHRIFTDDTAAAVLKNDEVLSNHCKSSYSCQFGGAVLSWPLVPINKRRPVDRALKEAG